jgi:uncharacterized protein YndB with AHSA1/START domain
MAYAHTEILIDAPIETVWQVMLDIAEYRQWNPFVTHIACADQPPQLGSDLTLHIHFANGMQRQEIERVTRLEPPAEVNRVITAALQYQFTGALHNWNLVRGQRLQVLNITLEGKTRYVTEENLTGWLSWAAPIKQVQNGFERHAAGLKQRCESLNHG